MVQSNFNHPAFIPIHMYMKNCGVDFAADVNRTWVHKIKDTAKIDSYSLGVVLAWLANWASHSMHVVNNVNYTGKKKKPTKLSKIMDALKDLIHVLCLQDSQHRVNVYDAVQLYQAFYDKYLQPRFIKQ